LHDFYSIPNKQPIFQKGVLWDALFSLRQYLLFLMNYRFLEIEPSVKSAAMEILTAIFIFYLLQ